MTHNHVIYLVADNAWLRWERALGRSLTLAAYKTWETSGLLLMIVISKQIKKGQAAKPIPFIPFRF